MDIFEPYEIEIKTGRNKDQVVNRFKKRARIDGDRFYIDSEPYGLISRSTVIGELSDSTDWTIITFKIYASTSLKVFSYLWLGGVGIAFMTFLIKAVISWKYSSEIHWTIVFWIVGFITTQLTFKISADIQEESIKQMIRE